MDIEFEVVITCHALELLRHCLHDCGEWNLDEIIADQLDQGDPCMDEVEQQLITVAKENGKDVSAVQAKYESLSSSDLMEYVYYNKDNIEFEGENRDDPDTINYRVYCEFETEKFIDNIE